MPVKTAIERSVHLARAAHVRRIVVHVIEFVWILFADALQGETGEVRGFGLSQRKLIRLTRLRQNLRLRSDKRKTQNDSYDVSVHACQDSFSIIPVEARLRPSVDF